MLLGLGLAGTMVLSSPGCRRQPPMGVVSGTLRLDGRPAANVLVTFLPDPAKGTKGPRSAAATDAQGRYQLRCDDQRDGAVQGWHRVVIEDLALYSMPRDENPPRTKAPPRSRIPPVYCDPRQTPLQVEVSQGPQAHDIDVSSTGKMPLPPRS
jgi:hypothetical protein